jgi:hypothetical protein
MNPKVSHKPSQPHSNDAKLTVPLAELLDCVACDLFCLFDFHFLVLLFRGVLAPFTHSRGSEDAKQGTEAERLARPGWNGPHV